MAPIGPEPTEPERAAVEAWLDTPIVVPNRKERRKRMKGQFRSQAGAVVTRKGAKGKQRKLI